MVSYLSIPLFETKIYLNVYEVDIFVENSSDHVWVEIPTTGQPLLVGCIYRSQSNDGDKDAAMQSSFITAKVVKSACEKNSNIRNQLYRLQYIVIVLPEILVRFAHYVQTVEGHWLAVLACSFLTLNRKAALKGPNRCLNH